MPNPMPHIVLTPLEQSLARMVAEARYSGSRERGERSFTPGPQPPGDRDLDGAGGEVAFCKFVQRYPDLAEGEHRQFDLVTADGRTVDVKTTTYPNGFLMVRKKTADVYVLMCGSFPRY